MDNFELWYRLHAKKGDMPESVAKYFNYKYGVKKRAGIISGDYTKQAIGLYVDYTNNITQRLGKAAGLTAGTSFNKFRMFGGRRRCNVLDDGTITAYYGDANFAEDGSNGQVMVIQPKFYYRVNAIETDPIDTGIGEHLRKANYWVSDKKLSGFKLHPAFVNENGEEVDYYLISAYEGSIYDTSASTYILDDAQVMNAAEDLFCSIAGAKPASGKTQNLTRPNIEQLCKNRGAGWHSLTIKIASAEQLLMLIELGTGNTQNAIGQGVVSISDNPNTTNNSSYTGSTSSLGNATGRAAQTVNERNGTEYTETVNSKTSITYRGVENFWGNIWKSAYGVNIWSNGSMGGGQPFICTDYNFAESKNSDNYIGAGFTITNASGYVKAFGYSADFDWLFMPSEVGGNANNLIGDYVYVTANLAAFRVVFLGGRWYGGTTAGGFYWRLTYGVGYRDRLIGGRAVHVPA